VRPWMDAIETKHERTVSEGHQARRGSGEFPTDGKTATVSARSIGNPIL
jgi:hypothetical protein